MAGQSVVVSRQLNADFSCAIVGGGWAGIAAAVELVERLPGSRIALIEAGRQLGGRAKSCGRRRLAPDTATPELDALAAQGLLDEGQHLLLGAYRATLALMRRVGVDPATALARLPLRLQDNDGFCFRLPAGAWPTPLRLALALISARGVGWREKLGAIKLAPQLFGTRQEDRGPDATVTDWLAGLGQQGTLVRRLWHPLCLAALNTPAERASARIFRNVLQDSLGSPEPDATDLLIPMQPLSRLLPDPAAAWLAGRGVTLATGVRIRRISPTDGGWLLSPAGGGLLSCRTLILATAPQHLAPLLADLDIAPPACDYEPIATLYLRYPSCVRLPFPLLALTGTGQWLIDRGDGLFAASFSGQGEWTQRPPAELARAAHREIAPLLALGADALPEWRLLLTRRATFSCTPGLVRMSAATPWPNLVIAGDHVWPDYPATLEGAVRSGIAAARQSAEYLSAT